MILILPVKFTPGSCPHSTRMKNGFHIIRYLIFDLYIQIPQVNPNLFTLYNLINPCTTFNSKQFHVALISRFWYLNA